MYIVHDEPDLTVREYWNELRALKERKGLKIYREAFREKVITDLWFHIRCCLGFWYMDEHLHGQVFMEFSKENQENDSLLLVPRGHCKTLWAIAEDTQQILANPNTAIAVITATKDLSESYSTMVGDILLKNKLIQSAFREIMPTQGKKGTWGKKGLTIPGRSRARLEMTLLSASLGTAITGQHPDKLRLDDITGKENNDKIGWQKGVELIEEGKRLLGSVGVFKWNATNWHDSAPSRLAEQGMLTGARGDFVVKRLSCFEDDDPSLPAIYPYKQGRWDPKDTRWSGYPHDRLIAEMNAKSPFARAFFSAQMRNNPMPEQDIPVKVDSINIYDPESKEEDAPRVPPLGEIESVTIETHGGGLLVYNEAMKIVEESALNIPFAQFTVGNQAGVTKADRIKAIVEPVVSAGKLWCPEWMIPEGDLDENNLKYELKRLGVAKHDDIADALHQALIGLSDTVVLEGEPAVVRIACDTAYTEDKRSDHTVLFAVAKDWKDRYWCLEYDRFQMQAASSIVHRIIAFYHKWSQTQSNQRSYNGNRAKVMKVAKKYA